VPTLDTILERPQPIGAFPLPAGYLLLPPTSDRAAAAALLRGGVPEGWPVEWWFFAAALDGDAESALSANDEGNGPLAAYNRFVLAPSTEHYAAALAIPALRPLTAVIGYALGFRDHPPLIGGLDGELRAHVLAAHAAHALTKGRPLDAIHHLETAVEAARSPSPLFASQLLGQLAAVLRDDQGHAAGAVSCYEEALRLASDTPLARLRAELWFGLGVTYQAQADGRREMLLEAAKAYQQAIQCGLSPDAHADLYAEAQNNLGLAYLSVPATSASDQLRMAVAVQSFREALRVYTRDAHPERWASTTLNLANALQYMPSGHPAHNLMQAVELYDEVLTVRARPADPVGYARVLANQANALAHLGMFAPALEKLSEAHKLFHWHDQPDAAASVMELVAQISACRERAAEPVGG
jgi:tetratricopeptide (TPR) repeat protein